MSDPKGQSAEESKESTMHGGSSAHLAEQISSPVLAINLDAEINELWKQPGLETAGRSAKTLVKHPDLRIVLMALRRGVRMAEHATAGRVSIQCLRGQIAIHVRNEIVDMPAGRVLVLDRNIPHDVVAAEDSSFLVTIAWPATEK